MTSPLCITNEDSILFVATSGGVYRSVDNGLTWGVLNLGVVTNSFSCMATMDSIIYIGTNGSLAVADDGIFKSSDLGVTWSKCRIGKIDQMQPFGNKLFINATGGIFSSNDQGISWSGMGTPIVDHMAATSNLLFGCEYGVGVYSRQVSDTTWTPLLTNGITDLDFKSIAAQDSVLCLATTGDFFISLNQGNTWNHPTNSGIINAPITSLLIDSNLIFGASAVGLIRSSDNGASWDTVLNSDISTIKKENGYLFAGTPDGLLKSIDRGVTWSTLYSVYSPSAIKCLANMDSIIIAGISNTVYFSNNNGQSWNSSNINGGNINCLLSIDSTLYVGTTSSNTGIFKGNLHDTSWTAINNGLGNKNINTLIHSGGIIYAGTANGLFSSSDSGLTWISLTISNALPYKNISAIVVDGQQIFVGTTNGIYVTQNNGTNWNLSGNGLPLATKIMSLAIKDSLLFAGTFGYGVFISSDHGTTWLPSNSGLPGTYIYVRLMCVINSNIFISLTSQSNSSLGVLYMSTDNGTSWVVNNPTVNNILYQKVNAVASNERDLFASSNSNFLLKKSLLQLPNSCAVITTSKSYVCDYDSVAIIANVTPGYTYQWLKAGIPIPGANASTFYVKEAATYSCRFGGTCVGTSPAITVYGKPSPELSISTNHFAICPHNDSSLVVVDSIVPSWTFQWYNLGGPIIGATQQNFFAKAMGSYYCIAIDTLSCKGMSNILLIGSNPYTDSTITAYDDTLICEGDSCHLEAVNAVGYIYQWILDGSYIPGATSVEYYAKQEGVYTCLVKYECFTFSNPISVKYSPRAYFIPHPDSVIANVWHLQNLSEGSTTLAYSWNWGDFSPPSQGLTASHLYTVPAEYNICLTVTDSGVCFNTYCDSLFAGAIYIIPPLNTGIEPSKNLPYSESIRIYPTQFNDKIHIISPSSNNAVNIYNVFGRPIYVAKIPSITTINTENFEKGLYVIEVSNGQLFQRQKIIK